MTNYEFDLSTSDFVNEDQFFTESFDLLALDALRPSLAPTLSSLIQDPIAYVPPAFDYILEEGSILFDNVRMSMGQEHLSVDVDYALPATTTALIDIPADAFVSFLKTAPIFF